MNEEEEPTKEVILQAFNNLNDQIRLRFDQMNASLDRIDNSLDRIDGSLDRMDISLDRMDNSLDLIDYVCLSDIDGSTMEWMWITNMSRINKTSFNVTKLFLNHLKSLPIDKEYVTCIIQLTYLIPTFPHVFNELPILQ